MTLKKKLFLGFSSILLLMTIVVSISATMLNSQNQDMNELVHDRYKRIDLVTAIENERSFTAKYIRDLLLGASVLSPQEVDRIDKSRFNASSALSTLLQDENDIQQRQKIMDLQRINQAYEHDVKEVLSLLQAGKREEALQLFLEEEQKYIRTDIQAKSVELQDREHEQMHLLLQKSEKTYSFTLRLMFILLGISLVIGFAVSLWVVKGFTRSISSVSRAMASIGTANTASLPRIKEISNDEIGEIALSFNQMAQVLEYHTKQGEEFNQTLQDQNWIEIKHAEISTLFQGVQDVKTLAELFISRVTPLLQASYGVFYVVEGGGVDQRLRPLASYAYQGKQSELSSFRTGEGLVGQCALDRQTIVLNEVPPNYVKIQSGLGNSSPKSIYISPIEYEGKVLAVVELASLNPFNPLQTKLLERIIENTGITVYSVNRQMQVKELLEQSQSLTEELQTQSEELQMQHEELRSINEQIERQYRDSELKTQELERTKLELEEKARQLTISSQFKSEFLANMSHELRTPLNSMLILAQMFAENIEGNLTEKQMIYAKSIHSAGSDLLNLINDILDLSKVESGKMEILASEVSLYDLQSELEQQFTPIADKKGLSFKVQMEEELSKILFTDAQRLVQILKNLLSNAFKFTENGSIVLGFRKPQEVDFIKQRLPKDIVLAISVKDTGIGISREKQSLIFEAFRQADGTMSRRYGGTGLGLSISRELAHLLGGTIALDSKEGKGSTFTLYLPNILPLSEEISDRSPLIAVGEEIAATTEANKSSEEVTAPEEQLPLQPKRSLNGKKVLIVDDDMRNIFALTTLLEKEKMTVLFSENGRDSLEVLKANRDIDLVLMDIMMPEMDGYTTMQAIRELPEFERLPIIALTAKAMKNDREKCIEAGASDYISKPINVEQLLSLIRVWLYR